MTTDRNDLAYWFPILAAVPGIRVPRTEIITTECKLWELLDSVEPDGYEAFLDALAAAAERIAPDGGPFFLRTGHTSGRHEWRRTCHVESVEDLDSHVGALVEFSVLADIMGLPTGTWAVREFLDLDWAFTAFDGMPVAREFRHFFRDGQPMCSHRYWPIDSIENPSRPDYAAILAEMNRPDARTQAESDRIVAQVAQAFEGAWSLDLAMGRDGEWWCIDMATAERSFHWPGCPNGEAC